MFSFSHFSLVFSRFRLFGFANLAALKAGKKGVGCRGEEHEIELIWSIKSGKTCVLWNKRNISSLFREGQRSGMVDLSWKTRAGQSLQILAHSEALQGVERQYDLLVDGTSFFHLSTITELGQKHQGDEDDAGGESAVSLDDTISRLGSQSVISEETPPEAMDYRLSIAGLGSNGMDSFGIKDELHSEVYTSALETVRYHIVECLPQVEGMVSRAIMEAFIAEFESSGSLSSSWSDTPFDSEGSQIELAALWDAFEWTRLNKGFAKCEDAEEQALVVMQKQVTATFKRIRNEELSSHAATRILLSVAALLGLKFSNSIPKDTVLLYNFPGSVDSEELREIASAFGYVESVAVAKRGTGFAFCRFVDGEAPLFMRDAINMGKLTLQGVKPNFLLLTENTGRDISASRTFESREGGGSLSGSSSKSHADTARDTYCSPVPSSLSEGSVHSLDYSDEHMCSPRCVTTKVLDATHQKIPETFSSFLYQDEFIQ